MVRRLRRFLKRPIADHDRRSAFAIVAVALLIAAVALSVIADPADRRTSSERPPIARTDLPPPARSASGSPAEAVDVARRFLDGYLAHLYGSGRAAEIRGASDRLRHQLAAQPVRVSPATRRQRPSVERIDGQRLADGWLVDAEIATATVSFPIVVVVADRPGGLVVTRLVED